MTTIEMNFNEICEAFSMLAQLGKGESYADCCRRNVQTLSGNARPIMEKRAELLAFYTKVETDVRKTLRAQWNDVIYYFAPLSKNNSIDFIARLVMLWHPYSTPDMDYHSLKEMQTRLSQQSKEEYIKQFGIYIQSFNQAFINSAENIDLSSIETLIAFILDMDYSKTDCLKIEDALLNYRAHQEKISDILSKTVELLYNYQKDIEHLLEAFCADWQAVSGDNDILSYLSAHFPMIAALPTSNLGNVIVPKIFSPFSQGFGMSMDETSGEPTSPLYMNLGLFYGEDLLPNLSFDSPKINHDKDYYLSILKSISDPTRFRILSLTKHEPMYGNELAEQLKLTTATVSHHTSQLVSNYLASIEIRGNRSYYHSNRDTLLECMAYLRKTFL